MRAGVDRRARRWLNVLIGLATIGSVITGPVLGSGDAAADLAPASQPGGQFVALPAAVRGLDAPSMAAKATQTVVLTGRSGIPASGVSGVTAQVIVGSPTAEGSIRAFANGAPNPAASTVLFQAGVPYTSTQSVIRVNSAGEANFYNNSDGTLRLVVDVTGYYLAGSQPDAQVYVPLPVSRIVDTRSALGVPASTPVPANGTITFQVAGAGGLPAAAAIGAVKLNITEASATQTGAWRIHHPGTASRTAYGHFVANRRQATTMITTLPADGRLSLHNVSTGVTHYLVDVVGYYRKLTTTAAGTRFYPVQPVRLLDTAAANGVPATTPIPAGATISLQVTGRGGVPASGVSVVALMIAARSATATGEVVAYPSGTTRPGLGSLSFPVSLPGSNLLWVPVGANGKVDIYNHSTGTVHLWGDLQAYGLAAQRPLPPVQVQASAGDRSAVLSWRAPADDGGAPIAKYTVTTTPGGATVTSTTTSASVTGLTNGTEYTFKVTATNAAGTSLPSASTSPVVPAAPIPPGQVAITDVYSRDSAIRVSWTPPTTGAGSVTGYKVTATPGNATANVGANARQATVSGLVNGTEYRFTVIASNANGSGPASTPSQPVAPTPAKVPVAPRVGLASPLNARIDVQWSPPPDGGTPITGYRVVANPGNHTVTTAADTTVAALTGLANGTAYTIEVYASNRVGASEPGTVSGVVPAAARVPGAPAGLQAAPSDVGVVDLAWTAPTDQGTSAITGYTITTEPATATVTITATSASVTGLDPTVAYRFHVAARNATGLGAKGSTNRPIKPAVTFRKDPIELTAASLATLRTDRVDGTMIFEQPSAQITTLKPGDIITAGPSAATPNGLLRKIDHVHNNGGLITIAASQVPLSEVLSEGAFSVSTADTTGATFVPAIPGVTLSQPLQHGATQTSRAAAAPSDELPVTLKPDGTVELKVEVPGGSKGPEGGFGSSVQLTGSIRPRFDFDIDVASFTVDTMISADLRFSGRVELGMIKKIAKRELIGTVHLPPMIRKLGRSALLKRVYVVLNPVIKVELVIEANGAVGLTSSVTYGHEAGMQVHKAGLTSAPVITPINNAKPDFSKAAPTFYGSAEVKVSLPVSGQLLGYNLAPVAGIETGPYVSLSANTHENPWWKLKIGFACKGFADLAKVFGGGLGWEGNVVADHVVFSRQAAGGFQGITINPVHAQTDPGIPFGFSYSTFGIEDPARLTLEWKVVQGGHGSIDQTGRYTPPTGEPGTNNWAVIQLTATEPLGKKHIAYASMIIGRDRPGVPLDVRAGPGPLSAVVEWRRPPDNGSPLFDYLLIATPVTGPGTDPVIATADPVDTDERIGTRIEGLSPESLYDIKLMASNALGLSDPVVIRGIRPLPAMLQPGIAANVATDRFGNLDRSGATPYGVGLSGNGRYAFFDILARSNLAPPEIYNPTSGVRYLIRKDLITGDIVVASRGLDGITPAPSASAYPSASYSGNVVAFTALINTPNGLTTRVWVHQLDTKQTWDAWTGIPQGHHAGYLKLSSDGATLAFEAQPDTGTGDNQSKIWRRTQTSSPQRIDKCLHWTVECNFGNFFSFDMSDDGRRIVYSFSGTSGGNAWGSAAALWDQATGATTDLTPGFVSEHVSDVAISGDGLIWAGMYYPDIDTRLGGLAVKRVGASRPNDADIIVPGLCLFPGCSVSPTDLTTDGQHITYEEYPQGAGVIQARVLDTATRFKETVGGGGHAGPSITPDGRTIAWIQGCSSGCPTGVQPGPWVRRRA